MHLTEKQNKEKTNPEDCVKLFMELKELGQTKYHYMCTASSLRKGKTKLALGILCMIHGPEKRWKDVMEEMTNAILQARELRGAGDKPVLRKYDPNNPQYFDEVKKAALYNQLVAASDEPDDQTPDVSGEVVEVRETTQDNNVVDIEFTDKSERGESKHSSAAQEYANASAAIVSSTSAVAN